MTIGNIIHNGMHAAKQIVFWILPDIVGKTIDQVYYERRLRCGNLVNEPELDLLKHFVSVGDTVLDVGANLGAYSLKLSSLVGANGHVHAFEPVPRTFRLLFSNLHRLRKHRNIHCHELAVGNFCGATTFHLPVEKWGLPNFYVGGLIQRSGTTKDFEVEVIKLDDWPMAHSMGPVQFIKVDIEGAELLFFQGAIEFLRCHKPAIVCELTPINLQPLKDILAPLGYEVFFYHSQTQKLQLMTRPDDIKGPNCLLLQEPHLASLPLLLQRS